MHQDFPLTSRVGSDGRSPSQTAGDMRASLIPVGDVHQKGTCPAPEYGDEGRGDGVPSGLVERVAGRV